MIAILKVVITDGVRGDIVKAEVMRMENGLLLDLRAVKRCGANG